PAVQHFASFDNPPRLARSEVEVLPLDLDGHQFPLTLQLNRSILCRAVSWLVCREYQKENREQTSDFGNHGHTPIQLSVGCQLNFNGPILFPWEGVARSMFSHARWPNASTRSKLGKRNSRDRILGDWRRRDTGFADIRREEV